MAGTLVVMHRLVFQSNERFHNELYYRCDRLNEIEISRSAVQQTHVKTISLKFNTFMNIIPVQHWARYTTIQRIHILASGQGSCLFRLWAVSSASVEDRLLAENLSTLDATPQPIFEELSLTDDLFWYIEVAMVSSDAKLTYVGVIGEAEVARDVDLEIVICTHKRETFLSRTVDNILTALNKDDYSGSHVSVTIVDNGGTVQGFEDSRIRVIPNKNLGGAGGFSRGIIEVLEGNRNSKTHVLLCDDDIVLPPETLLRTVSLLRVMRDERLGVHGGMMELERPAVLHELGEMYDVDHFHRNPLHGLDVTRSENVRRACEDCLALNEVSNLWGWWYTALPIESIENVGLPMPVFVKCDDIDYSLRLQAAGFRAVSVPGVVVWHPSHVAQEGVLNRYLASRNTLFLTSLHSETPIHSVTRQIRNYLGQAWNLLLLKKYACAHALLIGIRDFLRGPEWLGRGPDYWNGRLPDGSREKTDIMHSDPWIAGASIEMWYEYREPRVRKWIRRLTLNGHLVNFLLLKADMPWQPGHVCLPTGVHPAGPQVRALVFRRESVTYFDPARKVGIRVRHDRRQFWRGVRNLFVVLSVLVMRFVSLPSIIKDYRAHAYKWRDTCAWKSALLNSSNEGAQP